MSNDYVVNYSRCFVGAIQSGVAATEMHLMKKYILLFIIILQPTQRAVLSLWILKSWFAPDMKDLDWKLTHYKSIIHWGNSQKSPSSM